MIRAKWSSRLGFILAASGSAVGLGNLWKFPYITWENKGGAFVIVYLAATLLLGLPIMMAEILIGRRAQLSPVPAFEKLGGKKWVFAGWLGVVAGAVILSYYTVIAGWSIRSFFQCINWSFSGYAGSKVASLGFEQFLTNGPYQVGLTAVFSIMTSIIVLRGIKGGIEKATTVMMPILFGILIYLTITTLTLSGRDEALNTIFTFDFNSITLKSLLEAVGQAFFSLSLGLGAMIVYGSYIGKKESIFKSALSVVILDTAVAILACIAMFSIIYSLPDLKDNLSASSVGMLFITLPDLFYTKMPGGQILGPLFFILVAFAALSSTISLGEVVVSLLIDRLEWTRKKAVLISAAVLFLASILCALSLGANASLSEFEIFESKKGMLSTLDHLAANWMLPLGGLFTTIFVGWFLGKKACLAELGIKKSKVFFTIWLWLLRVVAPIAILALLIAVVSGKDFS